jgi:acyl carrier protein
VSQPSQADIEHWIVRHLSECLALAPHSIKRNDTFSELGVDSVTGMGMVGALGEWLALELDPTVTYDFPTVKLLSTQLHRLASRGLKEIA